MDNTCDIGDGLSRWFRGLPRPNHLFSPLKDDVYVYVIGCLLRFIRIELKGSNRVRVLKTLAHGFDGVSALEGNPYREVYAMAEKSLKPRVFVYRIEKGKKDPYEPKIVARLTGIKTMEIRAMRFNKKELIIILTGYPSFCLSIWKWTSEQELMVALCNEPSEFSDLLISPMNECHWVEYGKQHITFYDLQSFTKNDVIRTQIYLPQRQVSFDNADSMMGMSFAMKIISACFTHKGDFYVLDDHYGLHLLNQEDKILNWICSIGYTFLGLNITRIIPFGDAIAEVRKDGWIMIYDPPMPSGKMNLNKSLKLTSDIKRFIQIPGQADSFLAITEKESLLEGVEKGAIRQPICLPDIMYPNIVSATFIEPRSDYCAVLTEQGKVSVLDCDSGEVIEQWRLSFKPTGILSHPVLPFVFCGTSYGCMNVLDVRNLKKPKLISRTFLTKDPKSCLNKLTFTSQGRYLIAADTKNDKIFLMYGYPFEEFEYLDYAKLPGEIRHLNVSGCGKEDLRVQIMVYAKDKVQELCPTYVYNYSLNNERLSLIASQTIENPIKSISLSPMKKYLYTYHVEKHMLALTPFCDDNTWTVLQEPEQWIDSHFELDINRMFVQGDKLYSFGEDGYFHVHEAPQIPQKKDQTMKLKTLVKVQTHLFVDGGIRDGIVSLDGSQVIAIGCDGTFSRVRLHAKPKEPQWSLNGYEKPKLIEYQMASYSIDQEQFKAGKKPPNRIEMIRVKQVEAMHDVSSKGGKRSSQLKKRSLKIGKGKRKRTLKSNDTAAIEGEEEEEDEEEEIDEEEVVMVEEEATVEATEAKLTGDGESADIPEEVEEEEAEDEDQAVKEKVAKSRQKRAEIRKQIAEERKANETRSRTDGITEEDIKTLMEPKKSTETESQGLLLSAKEHAIIVIPEASETINKHKVEQSNTLNKSKSRKDKLKKMKFKNVKSKVGAQIRGEDKPKTDGTTEDEDQGSDDNNDSKETKLVKKVKSSKLPKESQTDVKPKPPVPVQTDLPKVTVNIPEKESHPTVGKSKAVVEKIKSSKVVGDKSIHKLESAESKDSKIKATVSAKDKKTETIILPKKESSPIITPKTAKIFEDIFDEEDDHNIVEFSRPKKSKTEQRVYEGADVDGVFCVSHAVPMDELPAPEFWAMYEYVLMLRQNNPRAVKLLEEFLKMIDLMKMLMQFNESREFQVEISEFNLDDKMEEMMQEKRTRFVQYCHIQMMSRNKLRHERILSLKKMIWENFEQKGLMFTGFRTKTLISNYPLSTFQDTFGNIIKQCQEERRLELRIEMIESNMGVLANEITLNIMKAELDLVDPGSRRFYIKSIMSMDPSAKFDDYDSSGEEKENEDDFIKSVFTELRIASASESQARTRTIESPAGGKYSKKQKQRLAPPKKNAKHLTDTTNLSSTVSTRDHKHNHIGMPSSRVRRLKQKKGALNREESEVRQRLKKRRFLLRDKVEQTVEEEHRRDSEHRRHKKKNWDKFMGHHHHHHNMFSTEPEKFLGFVLNGPEIQSGEDNFEEDPDAYVDDDDYSTASQSISKINLIKKIKPPKPYVIPHGIFGPRGLKGHGIQMLMGPEDNNISKKKKMRGQKNRRLEAKRRREEALQRKRNLKDTEESMTFVVESDEDLSEGDDETFIELKDSKLSSMNEQQRILYKSIEDIFDGSIIHELRDVHKYKRNPYVYHQFELFARHQFIRQMWLLMEETYRMKRFFNRMFDDARNWKISTIKKMVERNKRIREIYYYLILDLDILDETLDPNEDPLLIFSVKKSEIPIEKYLTAEQRRLEELRMANAKARKNTRMAKFRRKALKVMMGAKLETKREEMLINDIPKPEFMEKKDVMEYSLEEYLESIEYQKKVEELEIARAELIIELEAELYKLYRQNALDYNGTDLRVQELYNAKLQFHYNIIMEETKIQRLLRLVRITDDCQHEEDRVNDMLTRLKDSMKSTQALLAQLTTRKSECKIKVGDLGEKEKELDRKFRKDLGDVGQFFEFFIKNYRKKPKIPKGVDRAEIYEYGVKALHSPNIRAFARDNGDAAKSIVLSIMDIEDPMLMPVGCPRTFWDRFNKLRRERLAADFEIKSLNLDLDHINEGLSECKDREEESAKAMAAMLAILSHRTDLKNFFVYNTEFQFVSGKGNVEINFWNLQAHEDSMMTLSKTVERLNGRIFAASEVYIQDLRKSMIIHRDIKDIEWKFMVVKMAMQDVNQLFLDVNSSKPTKELLRVLRTGINLDTMYQDRINLVKYLQETSDKFQKTYLAARRRLAKMYIRQQKIQDKTNDGLKDWLKDQNKTTSLLKYIGIKSSPETRTKRYNERVNKFLVKGYMVRKMHQNFQTIDFLEGELTRYYKKSFPVL